MRFRVPDVSPGRYEVKIYDGSEEGQHYTWDFFRVTPKSSVPWGLLFALVAVLISAMLLYGARRSMFQSSPSRR